MKKTIVLISALAAAAAMGETTADTNSFSVEVAGSYKFAAADLYDGEGSPSVDLFGADLTFGYNFNKNNSINVRLGYAYGDKTTDGVKDEVSVFTLMPGYRYTYDLNDKVALFVGANAGISSLKCEFSYEDVKEDADKVGFGYSVDLGAQYALTDTVSIFAAYEFSGSTARPVDCDGDKVKSQTYHGIRAGVSVEF